MQCTWMIPCVCLYLPLCLCVLYVRHDMMRIYVIILILYVHILCPCVCVQAQECASLGLRNELLRERVDFLRYRMQHTSHHTAIAPSTTIPHTMLISNIHSVYVADYCDFNDFTRIFNLIMTNSLLCNCQLSCLNNGIRKHLAADIGALAFDPGVGVDYQMVLCVVPIYIISALYHIPYTIWNVYIDRQICLSDQLDFVLTIKN